MQMHSNESQKKTYYIYFSIRLRCQDCSHFSQATSAVKSDKGISILFWAALHFFASRIPSTEYIFAIIENLLVLEISSHFCFPGTRAKRRSATRHGEHHRNARRLDAFMHVLLQYWPPRRARPVSPCSSFGSRSTRDVDKNTRYYRDRRATKASRISPEAVQDYIKYPQSRATRLESQSAPTS